MKLKLSLALLCFVCLCACNRPPKTCKNVCPEGQQQRPLPDCSCFTPPPPPLVKADEDLQLKLFRAAFENDVAFIQDQLNKNIDVNSPIGVSKEANFLSFRAGLTKCPLLFDNITKYTNDLTMLFISLCSPKNEVFDLLLNARGIDVNIPTFSLTPYRVALITGDSYKIGALLKKGAQPDFTSSVNDLRRMLKAKNYDAAAVLMKYAEENGINVGEAFPTMASAIKEGNEKLITFLIDFGKMNPSDDNPETGRPYLLDIAMLGNQELLKTFVSAGAPIDSRDSKGLNAAMLVIRTQGEKGSGMVNFLLQNGLDPNSQDKQGNSLLVYAINTGSVPLVQKVLENGADVNLRNGRGRTPLFTSAESNNIEMVKLLLEYGANPKIKDKNGVTPALAAVQLGDMDIYDLLEAQGR